MICFLIVGFIGAGFHPVSKKDSIIFLILFYIALLASIGCFFILAMAALGLNATAPAAITLPEDQFHRLFIGLKLEKLKDPYGKLNSVKGNLSVIGALSIVIAVYFIVIAVTTTIHMSFDFFRRVCILLFNFSF